MNATVIVTHSVGREGRIRTDNPRSPRSMRYQIALLPVCVVPDPGVEPGFACEHRSVVPQKEDESVVLVSVLDFVNSEGGPTASPAKA